MVALPGPRGGLPSSVEPRGPGSLNTNRELTGPRPLQRLVRRQGDLSTPIPLPDPLHSISTSRSSTTSRLLDAELTTTTSLPTTKHSTLASIAFQMARVPPVCWPDGLPQLPTSTLADLPAPVPNPVRLWWPVERLAVQRRARRTSSSLMLLRFPCGGIVRCNGLLDGRTVRTGYIGDSFDREHG